MATETQESIYKPVNDAYTGMLIISLVAMITGGVLLFLDYQQYPESTPKAPAKFIPEPYKQPAGQEKVPEKPVEKPADPEKKDPEKKDPEMKKDDEKKDEKKDEEKKGARLNSPADSPIMSIRADDRFAVLVSALVANEFRR